jgi:FAD synthase
LREERTFENIDALKMQIARDVEVGRDVLMRTPFPE